VLTTEEPHRDYSPVW